LVILHDGWKLRARMSTALGYTPALLNPRTYNERLGHKALFDHNPLLVTTTDKISVRDYVTKTIGPEYLIPLLGTYDDPLDIPWDELPNSFVLKANNNCGANLLVADKSTLDREMATQTARVWLRQNYTHATGEWAYGQIKPRLLAEAFLQPDGDGRPPPDYKIYVFQGRPRLFDVHFDRFQPQYRSIQRDALTLGTLPFDWGDEDRPAEYSSYTPPHEIHTMLDLAAKLGAPFAHVRVDFYLCDEKIWFGELTHYTSNACAPFFPARYDRIVGDLWLHPDRAWPKGTL
jgi:hypothetical protein